MQVPLILHFYLSPRNQELHSPRQTPQDLKRKVSCEFRNKSWTRPFVWTKERAMGKKAQGTHGNSWFWAGVSLSRECLLYLCLIRLQHNVHQSDSRASTFEPAGSADVALTGASEFPRTSAGNHCSVHITWHDGRFGMKEECWQCWLPGPSPVILDHSSFHVLVKLNRKENMKNASQGWHGWWPSGQSSARKIRKKSFPLSKKPTPQNCSLRVPIAAMDNTSCFMYLRWCEQETLFDRNLEWKSVLLPSCMASRAVLPLSRLQGPTLLFLCFSQLSVHL